MRKSKKRLEEAQKQTEKIVREANKKIEKLGEHSSNIYERLEALQNQFNKIRNKPKKLKVQCDELEKIRLNWKQQVEQIEKDYETAKFKAGVGGGVGSVGSVGSLVSSITVTSNEVFTPLRPRTSIVAVPSFFP